MWIVKAKVYWVIELFYCPGCGLGEGGAQAHQHHQGGPEQGAVQEQQQWQGDNDSDDNDNDDKNN